LNRSHDYPLNEFFHHHPTPIQTILINHDQSPNDQDDKGSLAPLAPQIRTNSISIRSKLNPNLWGEGPGVRGFKHHHPTPITHYQTPNTQTTGFNLPLSVTKVESKFRKSKLRPIGCLEFCR
jgi:hypothetical protein